MQASAASVADRASAVIVRYARLGSLLAAAVATIGLIVAGLALLTGLAALDGAVQTAWTIVGAALLAAAVVPPLVASFRLHAVGRYAKQLVGELRGLLESGGEASQVVIETTEVTVDGSRGVVATAIPTMGRLRTQALRSGSAQRLNDALTALISLPILLAVAIIAMLVSAGAGFVLLLIWIF